MGNELLVDEKKWVEFATAVEKLASNTFADGIAFVMAAAPHGGSRITTFTNMEGSEARRMLRAVRRAHYDGPTRNVRLNS